MSMNGQMETQLGKVTIDPEVIALRMQVLLQWNVLELSVWLLST